MRIRSTINEKPIIAIVAVIAVAATAVWMGIGNGMSAQVKEGKLYFTDDDGKTWFADKATTVTPYTKDGKEVVRALVYQCKDGKPFVALLSRQNPNAPRNTTNVNNFPKVSSIEEAKRVMQTSGIPRYMNSRDSEAAVELKRPGEGSWEVYGKMSPASRAKLKPMCADGSTAELASP